MKTIVSIILLGWCAASTSHAAEILTFDTDLQGFQNAGGGGSFNWSSVNGGSMQLTAPGGWRGDMVKLQLADFAPLWSELQLAAANGGTLSFDMIARGSDQVGGGTPGSWFETVVVANSAAGWKDNNVSPGISWPMNPDAQSFHFNLPIVTSGSASGNFFVDLAGGWANLQLGLNNGPSFTTATAYFDNITIAAVPEPSTLALVGLGLAGLLIRRRRN